jgi:hypothetical protein
MSSVDDFCDVLFSKDPEGPGKVDLTIDVNEASEFFEVLLLIMTNGLKKWYGQRINIGDVHITHIAKLKTYFISFGVIIDIVEEDKPDIYSIDNRSYLNKKDLDEMTFTVEGPAKLYTVKFRFAPGAAPRWG